MSTIKILVIPADRRMDVQVRDVEPRWDVYREIIGGFVQPINIGAGNGNLYTDEDAKEKANAITNTRASALAFDLGWQPRPGDMLAGDVIFLGAIGAYDGVEESVPEHVLASASLYMPMADADVPSDKFVMTEE